MQLTNSWKKCDSHLRKAWLLAANDNDLNAKFNCIVSASKGFDADAYEARFSEATNAYHIRGIALKDIETLVEDSAVSHVTSGGKFSPS